MNSFLFSDPDSRVFETLQSKFDLKDLDVELAISLSHQMENLNLDKPESLPRHAVFLTLKQQITQCKTQNEKTDLKIQCEKFVREAFSDKFPELISSLKEILECNILPQEVINELRNMIMRFSFSYKFFLKYNNIVQTIDWTKKGSIKKIIKFQGFILKNRSDIVETTCLLVLMLNIIIEKSQEFIRAKSDILESENQATTVSLLLKHFQIQDYELFKSLSSAFSDFLLCNMQCVFDARNFTPSSISQTLNTLISGYLKTLALDDFDESIFLNEKNCSSSPSKFTPFSKQGGHFKKHFAAAYNHKKDANSTPVVQERKPVYAMNCQRVLNYSNEPKAEINEGSASNQNTNGFSQLKFLKDVPASPYTSKNLLISTPMTAAIEMYNWLHDISSKWKHKNKDNDNNYFAAFAENEQTILRNVFNSTLEPFLCHIIDFLYARQGENKDSEKLKTIKYSNKGGINTKESKYSFVFSLFFRVLEKFSTEKERIGFTCNIFKEEYLLGLFLCCIESVFFVLNVNEVSFADLIAKCEINVVILWVSFNDFLRCDRCEIFLPTPLKFHLLDIEIQLVSAGVWGPGSSLLNVFRDFFLAEQGNDLRLMEIDPEKENSRNKMNLNSVRPNSNIFNHQSEKVAPELELLFKRILSQCAFQIYQMVNTLNLGENLSEHVWSAMKFIFMCEPQLLVEKHMDQLILCNIYAVSKVFQIPLKFQDIISKYQETVSSPKQHILDVIYKVKLINSHEKGDIIMFYNQEFIPIMKSFIVTLQRRSKMPPKGPMTPLVKNPLISQNILDSPLSMVLPSGLQNCKKKELSQNNITMTPKTHMLYAFAESPLMKINEANLAKQKANVQAKKLIDFEDSFNGGKTINPNQRNFKKYEKDDLSKIEELNTENLIEKNIPSANKKSENKGNLNEYNAKSSQNITPIKIQIERNQTPRNNTQKFLKNLSNIQEANKTPTGSKNRFVRLNFENVIMNSDNNVKK